MAQRVHNLSKWTKLEDGEFITFENPKARTVVLEVNCPEECLFYVVQEVDGERFTQFLGLAKGRDSFEFGSDGPFDLLVNGEAYIYSFDGQMTVGVIEAPEIFTRIANRRQRNPQLEYMNFVIRQKQLDFEAKMEAETDRRLEEKMQGLERRYAAQRDAGTVNLNTLRTPGPGRPEAEPEGSIEPDVSGAGEDQGTHGGSRKRKRVPAPSSEPASSDLE